MKALALLLLLPLTSFAGNDGPSAQPQPPSPPAPSVLAEKTIYCGFFCPDGDRNGVRILQGGSVLTFSSKQNVPEQSKEVARLSETEVARIQAEIDGIHFTDLVSDKPGERDCFDAPSTVYNVFKTDGTKGEVAAWMGCHNYSLPNAQGQDLKLLLDRY